jgi:hypothetical protein
MISLGTLSKSDQEFDANGINDSICCPFDNQNATLDVEELETSTKPEELPEISISGSTQAKHYTAEHLDLGDVVVPEEDLGMESIGKQQKYLVNNIIGRRLNVLRDFTSCCAQIFIVRP